MRDSPHILSLAHDHTNPDISQNYQRFHKRNKMAATVFDSDVIRTLEASGYEEILTLFCDTAVQFLENLNTLSDAIRENTDVSARPEDIPVFRFHDVTTECEELRARCVFGWKHWREGVRGLVKAAFRKYDNLEVDVRVTAEEETRQGFVLELLVTPSADVISQHDDVKNERAPADAMTDGVARISPATFCKALPFHVMVDRSMCVVQVGHALARIMRNFRLKYDTFADRFELVAPPLDPDFDKLCQWQHLPVTVRYTRNKTRRDVTDSGSLSRCYSHPTKGRLPAQTGDVMLHGQMTYIEESGHLLFLLSPHAQSIAELTRQGFFFSDIPLHDATRDLLLLNEQLQVRVQGYHQQLQFV